MATDQGNNNKKREAKAEENYFNELIKQKENKKAELDKLLEVSNAKEKEIKNLEKLVIQKTIELNSLNNQIDNFNKEHGEQARIEVRQYYYKISLQDEMKRQQEEPTDMN